MTYPLTDNIDDFLVLNERGRQVKVFFEIRQFDQTQRKKEEDELLNKQQEEVQCESIAGEELSEGSELSKESQEQSIVSEEQLAIASGEKSTFTEEEAIFTEEQSIASWGESNIQLKKCKFHSKRNKKQSELDSKSESPSPPGMLARVLLKAFRESTLAPFLLEFNNNAGQTTKETQLAMLDLLKFSYCKAGEAAHWDKSAQIFPHIQYAIDFIEYAVNHANEDGTFTIPYVRHRLEHLKLDCQRITHLDSTLSHFCVLRHLNLSWNLIESTESFLMPPHLEYLNLEMNLLANVSFQNQPSLFHLQFLNISHNCLDDSSEMSILHQLNLLGLDASYNNFQTLDTLWLVLPKTLLSLVIIGNPFSVTADYASNVLHHMPQLLYLDDVQVQESEETSLWDDVQSYNEEDCSSNFDSSENDSGEEEGTPDREDAFQKQNNFITSCSSVPSQISCTVNMERVVRSKETSNVYDFQNEAELCFHCYRILQFTYMEPKLSTPVVSIIVEKEKTPLKKDKKKKGGKSVRSRDSTRKSVRSLEQFPGKLDPSKPLISKEGVDVLYRIEMEVPILSEILHEFVDFVTLAEDDNEVIPDTLLNRVNFKLPNNKHGTETSPQQTPSLQNIASLDDLPSENEATVFTVGMAKKALTNLKISGGDAINQAFKSTFFTNILPEASIMEFKPIYIRPPFTNLRLLSKMFFTQINLHFVQLLILKPMKAETTKAQRAGTKNAKNKNKNASRQSLKAPERLAKKSDDLNILQRTILHTITLDSMTEPTWVEKGQDFIWNREGLKRGENLANLVYIDDKAPAQMKKNVRKSAKATKGIPLPEDLTIHFGFSLKRTPNLGDERLI